MTAPSTSAPSADELLAHTDWLLQLARALVGDAAAPDVVQGTFEVALATPPKREGPIRPWLAGVARNLAKMSLRGRARREKRETAATASVLANEIPSSDELVERARMQQKVAAIVLELPEALRDVLLLRFFEGMSAAEIARAQGIPGATVRSRLAEALARVRGALDHQHGGDRKRWMALIAPLPVAAPSGPGAAVVGGLLVKIKIAIAVAVVAVAAFLAGRQFDWFGTEGADIGGPTKIADGRAKAPPKPVTPTPTSTAGASRAPVIAHDDDPKGTFRIEGQVIDEKDQPVSGALVAIDANPTLTVETGADGGFVFENLIARDYHIEATAQVGGPNGFAGYAGPTRLRLTEEPEPVTLRMREGGTVEVVVTSSDAAIAGAQVELRSTLTWTAETDDKGIATLRGVGPTWAPLVARAPGYASAAIMLSTSGNPAAPSRVSLTLARGAALSGKVVDEAGKPIGGARVVATATSEPFPVVDPRRDGVETKRDGTFSLPTIASGTWRLTATHGTHAPTTSAPISVDGKNEKRGVELVLTPGATIEGSVQDASGAPIASADVRVVVRGSTFWRAQRQAFTGADGTFAIAGLPRRAVDVVAAHATGSSAIVPIDLAAKPVQELVLKLDVTGAIEGTVVDSSGQPLGDAQVSAEPKYSGSLEEQQVWIVRGVQDAVTDQGGAFRFAGLPAGTYRLRAGRLGASESSMQLAKPVEVVVGAKPGDKVQLVLVDDGTIIGKVALPDGTAPAAFTVSISGTYPTPFATPDGSFTLPAAAGTHTIVVDGRRFLAAKAKQVTVEPGNPTDVGTISVQPGRSISGRVLDQNRVPVAGAKVAAGTLLTGGGAELYIPSESINDKETTTDDNGRFTLEGFSPASQVVVAGKDTMRSASIRLPASPDSANVDLILAKTTGLEGTITRDGKPLADTIVIANPIGATSSNFFVQTGPDGTFALDAIAPGPYVVYPMIGGGGPKPKDMFVQRVEVLANTRARVTIDASAGPTTVTISVKTDAGNVAPMAMVVLVSGTIDPKSGDQMRDIDQVAFTDKPIPIYMRAAIAGPAEIQGARIGPHTACAMPPPQDPSSNIKCVPIKITGAAKQAVEIVIPAAWYEAPPAGSGSSAP